MMWRTFGFGRSDGCAGEAHLGRRHKKIMDRLIRGTDVTWWVNQRILVNLEARLDKRTFVEELENM